MARTPIQAAQAFAAGDRAALADIPLHNVGIFASLADMDGLRFAWFWRYGGSRLTAWVMAGLVDLDMDARRWRLTELGRRVVRGEAV